MKQRKEKTMSRLITVLTFPVVGITFEGRADIIKEHVHDDDAISFILEDDNKYDPNAVAVIHRESSHQIGYINKNLAPTVRDFMEHAVVTDLKVKAVYTEPRLSVIIQMKVYEK